VRRFLILCASHPWWVLGVLLLVSLLAASQVPRVQVQVSADELLVMDDPERDFYETIRKRFGEDQVLLLYLQDDALLAADKLEVLRGVIEGLAAAPFTARVESLFSVPHLKSVEGYLDQKPYLATLPASAEEGQRIIEEALKNSFVRNVLLSADGRAMGVAIILKEGVQGGQDRQIVAAVTAITAALDGHYRHHFTIGFPQIRSEITDRILQEQGRLFPLAVATLLIVLLVALRHLVEIVAPLLTAAISILWTLGMMGALAIPLNVVTSIVPILLIVVGSTDDIHLLTEFRAAQRQGLAAPEALRHMAQKMGRIVVLTFVTTFVGFLSVGLSRIELLWQFGITAAAGLLFAFLATVSLIPALLALTQRRPPAAAALRRPAGRTAERYWQALERHRRAIFVAMTLATLAALAGIPAIQVNHNPVDSLGENSAVRAQIAQVNLDLSGLETFSIVIESGIQDTFLKERYLSELVKVQQFLAQQGLARSSTSFADYLALLNGAFQELEQPLLPQSDEVVNELMIFLDYQRVKGYVSPDYSTARILVRHNLSGSHQLERFLGELRTFLDSGLDPGLKARLTGDSVLTLSATRAMIDGQLQSILLLLLFIVALISLLFMDLRAGLLAALPNAVPVVVLFGCMGYAGIPLNIGTTMAAAIALGIAVDDTMHFMLRYNQELKVWKSQSQAIHTTIQSEALPVIATSMALMAGFLVFAGSDFEPIRQFGLLSALVMGIALAADLLITPLAISTLRLVTLWDLLSLQVRREVIARSPLFQGMREWQIRRFILSGRILELAPGEKVFALGDKSDELYLVMAGGVEVRVPRTGEAQADLVVDRFNTGQIFGEVALLAGESRRGNAIALESTTVLALSWDGIHEATRHHPLIAARLFLNLATDISHRWVRFIARARNNEICSPSVEERGDAERPTP
jgi:uncharacterized protein